MLIAADLQVRTRANFPVKDSGSDGELAGYTARGGGGLRGGGCSAPLHSGSPGDQLRGSGPASAQ